MIKFNKASTLACIIFSTIVLNGCGGGGGGSSAPADKTPTQNTPDTGTPDTETPDTETPDKETPVIDNSIDVTVIDGYIQGAIAFADLNLNGVQDDGEPSGTTSTGGKVTLVAAEDIDLDNAVIVVNIPEGAVDEDTITTANPSGTPITKEEAYQLVSLPGETIATPLTTLISMTASANAEGEVSAEDIQAAKETVADSLGLTEEEITADYIDSENEVLADVASLMVENEVIPKVVTENVTASVLLVASVVTEKITEAIVEDKVGASEEVIQAIAEAVTTATKEFVEANEDIITEDNIDNFTTVVDAVSDASVEAFDELTNSEEVITEEQLETTQLYSQVASTVVAELLIEEVESETPISEDTVEVATQTVEIIKESVIEQIEENTNNDETDNLTIDEISEIAVYTSEDAAEEVEELLQEGLTEEALAEELADLSEEVKAENDGIAETVKKTEEEVVFDDLDGDDIPNDTDDDIDGDGVLNADDAFTHNAHETLDTDGDGTGNNADLDDDGDEYSDLIEEAEGTDSLDKDSVPADLDNDKIPDSTDTDIDGDNFSNDMDEFPTDKDSWVTLGNMSFEDAELAACINASYESSTPNNEIYDVRCASEGVSSLSGLDSLTSLTSLDLPDNNITDLTPISGLTALTELTLEDNQITDISAIADLTLLTALALNGNEITDISALSSLTSLQLLRVSTQHVEDATVLSTLASLTHAWNDEGENLLADAVFSGDVSKVMSKSEPSTSGIVSVIDQDAGEAAVQPITLTDINGTFSIDNDGAWSFTLDQSNIRILNLFENTSVVASYEIFSSDDSKETISITIGGEGEDPNTQIARIADTKPDDAGTLRYLHSEALAAGKLSLKFNREAGATSVNPADEGGNAKGGYVSLYGSSTKSANALVDMRVLEGGNFSIRNAAGSIVLNQTYTEGTWVYVDITWDTGIVSESGAPMVTITINGEPISSVDGTSIVDGVLYSDSQDLATVAEGVMVASMRVGTSSAIIPTAYFVDDIALYSDVEGTNAVFSDDFESYELGTNLNPDDNEGSLYHSYTSEATVVAADDLTSPALTPFIFGELSATTKRDSTATLSGTVSVTGTSLNDDFIEAQADIATNYGTFSITAKGEWTYDIDANNSDIIELTDDNKMLTDSISILSTDGSIAADIVVTINGVSVPVYADEQVAKLVDTSESDSGKLRYKHTEQILAGKLSLRFNKEFGSISTNPADEGEVAKYAYIYLYGNTTSTYDALLDLKITNNGGISVRGSTSGEDVFLSQSYVPGQWVDVEVTWDATHALETVAPLLTVKINGELISSADGTSITDGSFYSKSGNLGSVSAGVQTVGAKLGDTGAILETAFYIDDIELYSDTAGTNMVFSDDFESYGLDTPLDSFENSDSAYDSNTHDAVVVAEDSIYIPTPPVIIGGQSGSVQNNVTDALNGIILVDGASIEEDIVVAQTDVLTNYGSFSIATTGEWAYIIDANNADVMALADENESVTDVIYITSADGYAIDITVTITGDDNSDVTAIIDNFDSYNVGGQIDLESADYTLGNVEDDGLNLVTVSNDVAKSGANSLYLYDGSDLNKPVVSRAFADGAIASGSVSVSVYIPTEGYLKGTYLHLGDEAGSSSSSKRFTEVVFGSSDVKFRDETGAQKTIHAYERDTWVDVTIAWVDTAITVTVDGVEYTSYDADGVPVPLVAENDLGAPKIFSIYVGDSATTGTYSYIDDLSSTLFGAPSPFSGDLVASTNNTSSDALNGTISSADAAQDEAFIFPQDAANTSYGLFSITDTGEWTYTVDTSNSELLGLASQDDILTDDIHIDAVDGSVIYLAINISGPTLNTPALFSGAFSGFMNNDGATVSGSLIITDPDEGENSVVAQQEVGDYGEFTITDGGEWVYTLDTSNSTVIELGEMAQLTDEFIVASVDGVEASIVITIIGTDNSDVTAITDNFDSYNVGGQIDLESVDYTLGNVEDDGLNLVTVSNDVAKSGANSLYLYDGSDLNKPVVSRAFADGAIASGSVSVSVYIPTEGYLKGTYLHLGDEAGSSSSSKRFTEVVFGSSDVKFRNELGTQVTLHAYERDTWVDVTIAWVGTAITVTVDGTEYTSYDVDGVSAPLIAENDLGAPKVFSIYVGDSSTTGTYSYIDDLGSTLFNGGDIVTPVDVDTSAYDKPTSYDSVANTIADLEVALSLAAEGDVIALADGTYTDVNFSIATDGVIVVAETSGAVFIEGTSTIELTGNNIIFEGFTFQNGQPTDSKGAIIIRGDYNRVTNCKIDGFNDSEPENGYKWISLAGGSTYGEVDHCTFTGKATEGALLVVWRDDETAQHHHIYRNIFSDYQYVAEEDIGDDNNAWETIRIGTSAQSQSSSYTTVEYNYFHDVNGEIEIISNKSGNNTYRYNTFESSAGLLTLRHGKDCTVDSNYFLIDDTQGGGIRVIDSGHTITNNYIEGANSTSNSRGAIALSSHQTAPELSGYWEVSNVLVANNTIINSKQSLHYGSSAKDNAPKSATISNNLIRNNIDGDGDYDYIRVTENDAMELLNIVTPTYSNNYFYGSTALGLDVVPEGVMLSDVALSQSTDGQYFATDESLNVGAPELQKLDFNSDVGANF